MARWDPGAGDRLRRAALELYGERGFENVSVAEISERAGLTRRTFFRYFADKREVLFAGSERLPDAVVEALAESDPSAAPLEAALGALRAVGVQVVDQVEPRQSREWRAVIAASPELQERERTKLAAVTGALADALRGRGTADETARLVARVAVAVLESAFARWAADDGTAFTRGFDDAVAEVAAGFATLDPTGSRV